MIADSVTLQIFEALAASLAGPAMPAILIARSIHFRRTPPSCREPGALGLGLFGTRDKGRIGVGWGTASGKLGCDPEQSQQLGGVALCAAIASRRALLGAPLSLRSIEKESPDAFS
jgi:hypothetical protein